MSSTSTAYARPPYVIRQCGGSVSWWLAAERRYCRGVSQRLVPSVLPDTVKQYRSGIGASSSYKVCTWCAQVGMFKVACLVHQSLASLAPTYPTTDIHLVSEYGRRPLRSYTDGTLTVLRTHNRFGDRSFAVAGPRLWNSLPISLWQISSFGQFRRYLKNHVFGIWEVTAHDFLRYINILTYLFTYLLVVRPQWNFLMPLTTRATACVLVYRELQVIFPEFVIPKLSQMQLQPEKPPRTLAIIRPDALEQYQGTAAHNNK